eukprot:1431659-Rhodomonas_salina.1
MAKTEAPSIMRTIAKRRSQSPTAAMSPYPTCEESHRKVTSQARGKSTTRRVYNGVWGVPCRAWPSCSKTRPGTLRGSGFQCPGSTIRYVSTGHGVARA